MTKKLKIEFAPGCFDHFEGTQEELDELIAEITKQFESGEFMENSKPIDIDSLMEEDPEMAEILLKQYTDSLDREDDPDYKKKMN
jgi:hypothetical protein